MTAPGLQAIMGEDNPDGLEAWIMEDDGTPRGLVRHVDESVQEDEDWRLGWE